MCCLTHLFVGLSVMLTSVENRSGIRFGGAWTDLTAGSLGALQPWAIQKGSYLVDPASSHMLVEIDGK